MEFFNTFSKWFSRKSSTETNISNDAHWIVLGQGADTINEASLLNANREWVFIATDKVAKAVSSVRFKVMRYSRSKDDQEVFDGPLAEFLEKPGVNLTGKDFIYLNTVYKELTGNAFWLPQGRKVAPIIPTSVKPVVQNGVLTHYRVGNSVLGIDKVLHDRYIDPARPYWGVGKLSKVAKWVDTSVFANDFLRMFFINGATFGGFLETEEETEERIKLIKAGLQNDHTGVRNAHKLGVLPKGVKYSKTTANMSEMQMGETDDRYRDKILSAFGVPKTLVGLSNDVNRATAEAAEYVFARYTVKPIVEDFVEFLNVYVAPMLDKTGSYYFAYDEFVPVNQEIALKEREIALNKQPYKTVNEVRAEAGLPPVTGGDVVYGNALQVPLGSPAPVNTPVDPLKDNNTDPDVPKPAKAQKRNLPTHVRKAAKKDELKDNLASALEKFLGQIKDTDNTRVLEDEAAHKEFAGRVEAYRDQIEKAVRDFNNRQERQVLLDLNSITKAVNKNDLFDQEQEVVAMVDIVTPILSGLLTEQAIAEFEALGLVGPFNSGSELVRRTLEIAAKRLAESYNSTTADLLKKQLDEGIAAGEGLADLTKRVQTVYQYSSVVRAKAVAQTESFYIANKANELAYEQSGVVKTKRWYTAEDEMICPFCRPLHGKIIDVNETYFKKGDVYTVIDIDKNGNPKEISTKLDYRAIDVPPLHTNCRCFIRPEQIEISS